MRNPTTTFNEFVSLPRVHQFIEYIKTLLPPPTTRNIWLSICAVVAIQNLVVFTNTQITGNAITALIVWGGALICMEDKIEDFQPHPSKLSLLFGSLIVIYTIFRTARIIETDSFLYLLAPVSGIGLLLLANPCKELVHYKETLFVLTLLPLFVIVQIIVATHITDDLSLLTAKFVLFWLNILGISPLKLINDTIYVDGGAVQVMHECNGFEMIMQMIITSLIFLMAFPLRSRIARVLILFTSPLIGFIVNSIRIALLAIFTSFNTANGRYLFDFFHEQAGSLIFSGISVFVLGYLYLALLNRELPPVEVT